MFLASAIRYLVYQLFFCLFDSVVVNLHLLGEIFFQPGIFLHQSEDKLHRHPLLYLYRWFSEFLAVEPCLRPPSYACPVGIDAHHTWYVKTLYVDVEFRQRVNDPTARYGFGLDFFFTSSARVERYTSCRKAR